MAQSCAVLRNEMGQTKRSCSSFTFCLIILRVFFFFPSVQQPQICIKHMQICFLMAESEEELKNLVVRVKEESEKLD